MKRYDEKYYAVYGDAQQFRADVREQYVGKIVMYKDSINHNITKLLIDIDVYQSELMQVLCE